MTEEIPDSSKVVSRYLNKKAKDIGCSQEEFACGILMVYVTKMVSEHVKPCKICSENAEVIDRLGFLYALSIELLSRVVKKSQKETEQMFNEMFPVMKEMYDD